MALAWRLDVRIFLNRLIYIARCMFVPCRFAVSGVFFLRNFLCLVVRICQMFLCNGLFFIKKGDKREFCALCMPKYINGLMWKCGFTGHGFFIKSGLKIFFRRAAPCFIHVIKQEYR